MAALLKAGLTLAKNLLKKMAKEYVKGKAKDAATDSKILKFLLIAVISVVISVPLVIFAVLGNIVCTIDKCDDDTGKQEDVIDLATMKDIAGRMEQLRLDTNKEATEPGENYGRYSIKLEEDDSSSEDNAKDELVESASEALGTSDSTTHADWHKWVTGETTNVNEGLLGRLADVGQYYNKPVIIHSGWRHFSEQNELFVCFQNGGSLNGSKCNLAADPMNDSHVLGLAADVTGWLQTDVSSSEIERFGLAKEVPGENWHIQAKGFIYVQKDQRTSYMIDGYGVPQGVVDMMYQEAGRTDIPKVIPSLSADAVVSSGGSTSSGSGESEAYIHLLALQQADELDMTVLTEKDLNIEEEKGSNLGKTWTLAKAIKKDVENYTYDDADTNMRANDEDWNTKQYMKLARWEIQKCYLIGDESRKNFLEKIFGGGPKPCDYINGKVKDIVPAKLQGVVSQVSEQKVCELTKDGECVAWTTDKTVTYPEVQKLLYSYKDISLFERKDQFEDTIQEILDTLYDRTAGPETVSSDASYSPTFITPLEKGTYKVDKKYGQDDSKGIFFKVDRLTPIYAATGGEIVATYEDETGKNTIIIKSSNSGYVEYKGVSEVLVKSGGVQQAQLIGSINKDTPLELRMCSKISDSNHTPTCTNASDPESGDFKIKLESGIDEKTSKEREKKYAEWKKSDETIFMPGFSSLSNLGKLSAEYESSGDPGICVMDTAEGGLQCGTYQISAATKTMDEFIGYLKDAYPDYYKKLYGVPQTMAQFKPVWENLYNSDKARFTEAQHNFIGSTHYQRIADRIKNEYGVDVTKRNVAVQEMVWSYSVQHRNNTLTAWGAAIGKNGASMSDKEIITRMYDYRLANWPYTTRYTAEKKKALALLESTS